MARKPKDVPVAEPVAGPVAVAPAPVVVVAEPVPEVAKDAGSALYVDRSGANRSQTMSEGAANFAFHTEQARTDAKPSSETE